MRAGLIALALLLLIVVAVVLLTGLDLSDLPRNIPTD